jgi:2-iminobutanoate/2-iminopropanoate deaminase
MPIAAHAGRPERFCRAATRGFSVAGKKEALTTKTNRRRFFQTGVAAAAATAAAAPVAAQEKTVRKVYGSGSKTGRPSLFNSVVSYGNLVFVAGIGAHYEGDIKAHTKTVLDGIQQQLEKAGSSMEKVLKCNVYLNDLKDYAGMNEVYQGRFGAEPPVRTTIAAAGGIPGNSLVEIDVIAYI